jgi:hypothetical protein
MPKYLIPLLVGLTIVLPAHAAKGYHLWYDENGQAVYSQFAPDDGTPVQTVKPPPPPAESPEVAQQRLQEQIQKSADFFEDKKLSRDKAAEASKEVAKNKERCEAARKNLEVLNGRPQSLIVGADGVARRTSEEEREKSRAETEKIIAESCK